MIAGLLAYPRKLARVFLMTDKDWYSYGEIRYSLEQILFLLLHKALLESGRWPPEHKDTGYTGSSKGRAYKHEGYFVKPIIIIAELKARLEATGFDGKLVVERYTNGYDELDLADRHKMDYWEVVKRISKALNYCQGANRKWYSYRTWQIIRGIFT